MENLTNCVSWTLGVSIAF